LENADHLINLFDRAPLVAIRRPPGWQGCYSVRHHRSAGILPHRRRFAILAILAILAIFAIPIASGSHGRFEITPMFLRPWLSHVSPPAIQTAIFAVFLEHKALASWA
jgi:hypothetical protein